MASVICAARYSGVRSPRDWKRVDPATWVSHGLLLECGDVSRFCKPLLRTMAADSSQTPSFSYFYLRAALASCRTVQYGWRSAKSEDVEGKSSIGG